MPKTSVRSKTRDASDAIAHAVAHRVRVDILTVLHEAPASQKELAEKLHEPLSTITHHINELNGAGAIEVAFAKEVGNVKQQFWRALKTSSYEPDDLARMSRDERQMLNRIIIQSIIAEALASLRTGLIGGDPYAATAWDRLWLDEQGYRDLNESVCRFFDRNFEIAAEAAARMGETGEEGNTYIASAMTFQRSRREVNTSASFERLE